MTYKDLDSLILLYGEDGITSDGLSFKPDEEVDTDALVRAYINKHSQLETPNDFAKLRLLLDANTPTPDPPVSLTEYLNILMDEIQPCIHNEYMWTIAPMFTPAARRSQSKIYYSTRESCEEMVIVLAEKGKLLRDKLGIYGFITGSGAKYRIERQLITSLYNNR